MNIHAIIGLGVNGKENAGCGYLNLINTNAFDKPMSDIISSCNKAAGESINTAGDEIRQIHCDTDVDDEVIIDATVLTDGAWQKRGHDSLNSVVTVIQNDISKCIDYRIPLKKCNAYSKCENKKDSLEFEKLISGHDRSINHVE